MLLCWADMHTYAYIPIKAMMREIVNLEQAINQSAYECLGTQLRPSRPDFHPQFKIGICDFKQTVWDLAQIHQTIDWYDQPLGSYHIPTDSQTSQQLIQAYLTRPHHLRFHKHKCLVAAVAQNLLTRAAPTRR